MILQEPAAVDYLTRSIRQQYTECHNFDDLASIHAKAVELLKLIERECVTRYMNRYYYTDPTPLTKLKG